jgi:hypothetical protein
MTAAFAKRGGTKTTETSAAGVEDRDVAALGRDGLAALARGDARDDVRVRPEHADRVLGALRAGDALDEDLGVLGEEDRHG